MNSPTSIQPLTWSRDVPKIRIPVPNDECQGQLRGDDQLFIRLLCSKKEGNISVAQFRLPPPHSLHLYIISTKYSYEHYAYRNCTTATSANSIILEATPPVHRK